MNSIWTKYALLPSGWAQNTRISFENGSISKIEIGVAIGPNDETANCVIPGMGNVHSHAFQRGMAGLAEQRSSTKSDNFWSWREVMYHFLDRLSPDDVRIIAQMAYMEMLEGGFTQVGEFHYLHHDTNGEKYANIAQMAEEIVTASDETGINLTLLPVFYAHSDFGGKAPNHGQRRFINNLDDYFELFAKCQNLIKGSNRMGIAPHSLRAVTKDELSALVEFWPKGPVHIHASEQTKEVEDCIGFFKKRPIEWLLDNFEINQNWCFIHSTHINEIETARLAKSGAIVGLCPLTEANLGDGIFPALEYLDHGGRFGIGTDSNILIDAARELCALEYGVRLSKRQRNVLASVEYSSVGRNLFEKAIQGGAQALDHKAEIKIGNHATFVSLNALDCEINDKNPDLFLDKWIFASRESCIDCVWVNGNKLVSKGQHTKRDKIKARYQSTLSSILRNI